MNPNKLSLLAIIAVIAGVIFFYDLHHYLSIDYFLQQKTFIENFYQNNTALTYALFFTLYIFATALSLPGATILTLVAGALFGLIDGILLVSFASTIGATMAFWVSRYLFRENIQNKFSAQLQPINQGIEKEGAFYLFTLRLVPVFPFFMINLLMGLSSIRTITFYWVSQLGMLAGTIVYVNAGTELGKLDSLSGILSPTLLGSFVLLGVFPLIAKRMIGLLKTKKQLSGYKKPKHFDNNLVVIGAGAGGLVSAYIAAAVKAKVTLIEKHKMGGDCLNTGCVPSKAILRSAKIMSYINRAEEFGIESKEPTINFSKVMERVRSIVTKIEPHDSIDRYTKLGVECITGQAEIISPYCVKVNGQEITTRNIIVATGARPFVPNIPGLEHSGYLTSDTLWEINELPKRLIVLGAGPIGCELSLAFSRLGSEVTLVEQADKIMIREDDDVSATVKQQFDHEGIEVLTGYRALRVQHIGNKQLICQQGDKTKSIAFDQILVAVGRIANTENFGLEKIGVELTERGTIAVNDFLQTNVPSIYACGDVSSSYQFTHTAAHEAWYAAVNSLFGGIKRFRSDYSVIPRVTFTDPEVACVGLTEKEAIKQEVNYEITKYNLDDLDRAITDSEIHGFVKVLTIPGKDTILGATIVGYHAGELIAEYVQAIKYKIGLNKILGTIHAYPTLVEANKYAAGQWKKAHVSERALSYLRAFHTWRRSEKKSGNPELINEQAQG